MSVFSESLNKFGNIIIYTEADVVTASIKYIIL